MSSKYGNDYLRSFLFRGIQPQCFRRRASSGPAPIPPVISILPRFILLFLVHPRRRSRRHRHRHRRRRSLLSPPPPWAIPPKTLSVNPPHHIIFCITDLKHWPLTPLPLCSKVRILFRCHLFSLPGKGPLTVGGFCPVSYTFSPMDALLSHHYQDHSRPGSSSSNASMTMDHLAYQPSSQTSLGFQPHYPPQRQLSQRRPSPTSSLQISTTSVSQEQDADEQTAHPSRMQPQFPPPQAQSQQSATSTESAPVKSASSAMVFTRPLTHREQELLAHLDRLKFFLATAPSRWNADEPDDTDPSSIPVGHPSSTHPALNRFLLPNQEYVSCVLWSGLYHITGTDIVRALVFRFEAFGRPVRNMKKFEEGVFSDLRNLKPGTDACLEEPKVRNSQPLS